MAAPFATPFKIPVDPTVTIAALLLLHAPPVIASVNWEKDPVQIFVIPVIAVGVVFIVTTAVDLQPDARVNVMVEVPVVTPFTIPVAEPMVATLGVLLVHVPPSALCNVVEDPTQAVNVPVIAGVGFTVIVLVVVFVNPLPSVIVTVYI